MAKWAKDKKTLTVSVLLVLGIMMLVSFCLENRLYYRQQREPHNASANLAVVGEITSKTKISQDIYVTRDNLNGIELQFGTYIRKNSSTVHIALFQEDRLIASKIILAQELKDNAYERLSFDKIMDSSKRNLRLEVWSEDAVSGNAITLWKNENQDGILRVDGNVISGSLNYVLCYKEFSWKYSLVILGLLLLVCLLVLLNTKEKGMSVFPGGKSIFYILLLVLSMFLLFLRNSEPFFFPTFYAEDGIFTSMLLTMDFSQVVVSARNDFPVLGLIAMLQCGLWISQLLYGNDLSMLPMINAVISYLFIAMIAIVGYFTFRRYSEFLAIFAYLCVLLMPLGTSGNETIARILNFAFLFPTLTVFCLIQRYGEAHYTIKVACIDLFNVVSCLTLPVSYGLVAIYIVYEYFVKKQNMDWKMMLYRWSIPMMTVLLLGLNYKGLLHSQGGTLGLPFDKTHLIEFAVGRAFIYPFVSGYWHYFSDSLVIVLFMAYLLVVIAAGIVVWRKKEDLWYYLLLSTTFIYWGGLVIPRVGWTSVFKGYLSTYPDRYFYGLNILVMILCLAGLYILSKQSVWIKGKLYIAIFLALSLINNGNLFEMDNPSMTWRQYGTFKESLRTSMQGQDIDSLNKTGIVMVPIYPNEPWQMGIPLKYAKETANSSRGESR